MSSLVLKDLRVLRPWWWLIVPGHVLFAANGIVTPPAFFAVHVALTWAYTVILLVVDWSQDADRFVASLPVSRDDAVRARYAGTLAAALVGTVLYALYGRVLLGLDAERVLARWPDPPGWESAGGLLAFFLVAWLVSVAYLPFYFGAGLGKGTWLFLASLAPAVVAGAILAREGAFPGKATGMPEPMGNPPVALLALAVAGALGWMSLRLSFRLYDRRDL